MAAKPSEISEFWKWFQDNEHRLRAHDPAVDNLPRQMWLQLYWINPSLGVRFGDVGIDGKRELIFTGNGFGRVFEDVSQVIRAAPESAHWRFRAFVPGQWPPAPLQRNGARLDPEALYFTAEPWDEKVLITLFVPDLTTDPDQRIAINSMARQLVAGTFGEVEFAHLVARVEVAPLRPGDRQILFPFAVLPVEIGRYFPDSNLHTLHAIAQGAALE